MQRSFPVLTKEPSMYMYSNPSNTSNVFQLTGSGENAGSHELTVSLLLLVMCMSVSFSCNSSTYTTYRTNILLTFTLKIYLLLIILILTLLIHALLYNTVLNRLKEIRIYLQYDSTNNTILVNEAYQICELGSFFIIYLAM